MRAQQPQRPQLLACGERSLVSTADQRDRRANGLADNAREVRVVGASKQQGIHIGGANRGQQSLGEGRDLTTTGLVALDKFDQSRTRRRCQRYRATSCGNRVFIGARGDRPHRSDHPDAIITGDPDERSRPRLDNPNHRHRQLCGKFL